MSEIIERRDNRNTGAVVDNGVVRKQKEIPKIKAISAAELVNTEIPPLEFIVNSIIPSIGLAMLGAPPKSFKSYWCIDMSLCIATGSRFLGFETSRKSVIYMDLESTKRRPKARIEQIAKNIVPDNFYIVTAEDHVQRIGEGLENQLEELLEDHPDVGLIVIDVFKKVRAPQKRGQNDYDRDYEDLGALKAFADAHNICILVIHHTRKMKDPNDPFNELAGSSGVMGTLDAAFVISKEKRESKEAKLYITGRDIEDQVLAIEFDMSIFKWRNLGDAEAVQHAKAIEEYKNSKLVKLIKILLEQGKGEIKYTAKELKEASHYIEGGRLSLWDSEQKIGTDLVKYKDLFEEVDAIEVIKDDRTKGRRGYKFIIGNPYQNNNVTHVTHVTGKQETLDLSGV